MLPAGFEPAILASERPETHALDRAVTGTRKQNTYGVILYSLEFRSKHRTHCLPAGLDNLPAATAHTYTRL